MHPVRSVRAAVLAGGLALFLPAAAAAEHDYDEGWHGRRHHGYFQFGWGSHAPYGHSYGHRHGPGCGHHYGYGHGYRYFRPHWGHFQPHWGHRNHWGHHGPRWGFRQGHHGDDFGHHRGGHHRGGRGHWD